MEILPESLRNLWNEWELRVTVLLSLCFQIILIILGSRRKHTANHWVRDILWLAYQSADTVAILSLGILFSRRGQKVDILLDQEYVLMAFWAPFLLLHLGGPNNFTAYSLEDNELWLRHLLNLVTQVIVALYIFLKSWKGDHINLLAIPMFIAGIIKYCERIWALMSASNDHFRKSLLPRPDPGKDYPKFTKEYISRREQGNDTMYAETIQPFSADDVDKDIAPDAKIFHDAYFLFRIFRRLFTDLILSFKDWKYSSSILENLQPLDAFKVVEIELGFMYDVLYTKAILVNSFVGIFFRFIVFFCIASTLVAFPFVDTNHYSGINTIITYILLGVAIALEIYALILFVLSDWTMLWFFPKNKWMSCFRAIVSKKKRWSDSMEQHNLLFSLNLIDNPTKFIKVQRFFGAWQVFKSFQYRTLKPKGVPSHLKELIFTKLLEKSKLAQDLRALKKLCAHRGGKILEEKDRLGEFGWSVEVEFDQSILLWHIATDLCYYSDLNKPQNDNNSKYSKMLSDYMLYILIMHPTMLPKGIAQIRFQDTCAEAMKFFQERSVSGQIEEHVRMLLEVNTEIPPNVVKGDTSKSVLFDACRLAKSLNKLAVEQRREIIFNVWLEMLSHAAAQCRWVYHAQQLSYGGELLTHVCLLMAHLGLSEQYQISHGEARTWDFDTLA